MGFEFYFTLWLIVDSDTGARWRTGKSTVMDCKG